MASEHDAFFAAPSEYGWNDHQVNLIDNMPKFDEFSRDPASLMWLNIALLDNESTISERLVALDALRSYWRSKWGYEFDDFFDWKGWREWVSP